MGGEVPAARGATCVAPVPALCARATRVRTAASKLVLVVLRASMALLLAVGGVQMSDIVGNEEAIRRLAVIAEEGNMVRLPCSCSRLRVHVNACVRACVHVGVHDVCV